MTYTIAVCTVKTPDDGQRNCPKHVGFYSKNKFEKLVHLVGFITRICCVCLMFSAKHNLYFSFFFRKRRGAINAKQLAYLEKYRPKSRLKLKNGHKNACCLQ